MCSQNDRTNKNNLTNRWNTNKDKMQTWNHLAWRRDAKAARHFCLSSTSGGSLTDSVSIGGWDKKTRYSLTKGFYFCLTARGSRQRGEMGEGNLLHWKQLKQKPSLCR